MAAYIDTELKPTPMIFGEEGKRFLERTANVKPLNKKKLAEMRKSAARQRMTTYEEYMKMYGQK
ncbi:MAG: hypothetical protein IK117_02090 [Bacteroidales bacterium]|nr:hypothetical protein [Bacteroidales bacterium]